MVKENAFITSVASWYVVGVSVYTHVAATSGFGLHIFVGLFDEHGWYLGVTLSRKLDAELSYR